VNWTTEAPTTHGLYWWRPNTRLIGEAVNVYENKDIGPYVMATVDGTTWALPVKELPGEWGSESVERPVEKGQP